MPGHEHDAMRAALRDELDRRDLADAEHREHHDWVRERINKERARAEFWNQLAQKSLPALIWSLLAGGATALWHLIRTHVNWN